jgi:hypothetical protein
MPAHIVEALGPGKTFADADQYLCAARRSRIALLEFWPVLDSPWLMRAWLHSPGDGREPDFRRSITVDRKGETTFGEWLCEE